MLVLAMEFSRDVRAVAMPPSDRTRQRSVGTDIGVVSAGSTYRQHHFGRHSSTGPVTGPVGGVPPENGTEVAQQVAAPTLEDESCKGVITTRSRIARGQLGSGRIKTIRQVLLRKEVIQPHLPVRLPCYDFTPITNPTFDSSLLAVGPLASGVTDFRGVTGGVYKARERIHPGVADPGLLATPTSRSRVADCDPN